MRKISLLFVLLLISITCPAVQSENDYWNADEYLKNSDLEQEYADAFLKNIHLNGNENILDIGCGAGLFAIKIAKKVPEGRVIGLDSSYSMIQKARMLKEKYKFDNLIYLNAQVEDFALNENFELIFAIHLMHWVKDQKQALRNMFLHLKPMGKIYIIMAPSNEESALDSAIKSTMKRWGPDFASFDNPLNLYDIERYRKLMVEAGFRIDNISYTYQQKYYFDKLQFSGWLKQWLPHYKYLPAEKRELFLNELVDNYIVNAGDKDNKKILWGEYIMYIEATRVA